MRHVGESRFAARRPSLGSAPEPGISVSECLTISAFWSAQVYMITRDELFDVANDFPKTNDYIRWCAIRLAFIRTMQRCGPPRHHASSRLMALAVCRRQCSFACVKPPMRSVPSKGVPFATLRNPRLI